MAVRTALAVIAFFVLAQPSLAEESREPALKVGAGSRSCAQFARDYTASPEIMEGLYFTWAQGYLTGFSFASGGVDQSVDLMPPSRGESWQKSFIREYCQSHPLSPYSEAVAALNLELIRFHHGK